MSDLEQTTPPVWNLLPYQIQLLDRAAAAHKRAQHVRLHCPHNSRILRRHKMYLKRYTSTMNKFINHATKLAYT